MAVQTPMIRDLSWIDGLYLLYALRWTIFLTVFALVGGAPLALLVASLGNQANATAQLVSRTYIGFVQGIPLLAWLFLFFFGFPIFGIDVPAWLAATCAFSVYTGAFLGEIWRGALQSIPKTQWEASASIGMSHLEQLRYVIIPQAVRIATPPTVGFIMQLIKNTSLAAVIGFVELTREGQMTAAATLAPLAVYVVVGALYFALCYPLTRYSRFLERRLLRGAR
jgi:polar amino acid transport system permease protein